MKKWADFIITHVKYNDEHTRISKANCKPDHGTQLGQSLIKTRQEIVNDIKNGKSYVTAYDKDGDWQKGDDVMAYELDGQYFICTDGNKKNEDNLGNLPEF